MGERTLIDLYAGAGGLTAGFVRAGFIPRLAVETNPDAARSYAANFGNHVVRDRVENILQWPEVDVVVGGPPCQGFSTLNRKRTGDRRNRAWRDFIRVVAASRPQAFVLENVPAFLRTREFKAMERYARWLGYRISAGVLNSADFGVPQVRRRAVVIGGRNGPPGLPSGGFSAARTNRRGWRTVRSALGHLGEPCDPPPRSQWSAPRALLSWHVRRHPTALSRERYAAIPPGGNRFDLARLRPDLLPACWARKAAGGHDQMGRLHWERPAVTIRTEFYKPEKGRYLHPVAPRSLTVAEGGLLQSFPGTFKFAGSPTSVARQIGNAVPPRLALCVARHVRNYLGRAAASSQP